jgi:hypothetical protein
MDIPTGSARVHSKCDLFDWGCDVCICQLFWDMRNNQLGVESVSMAVVSSR